MPNSKRILRRSLLATTAAAAAAAAATGAHAATEMKADLSSVDAKLVALAEEYLAQTAEYARLATAGDVAADRIKEIEATMKAGPAASKRIKAIQAEIAEISAQGDATNGRRQEIEDAMQEIDAKTAVGDRAKATIGLLLLEGDDDGPLNVDNTFVWSLLKNIVNRVD